MKVIEILKLLQEPLSLLQKSCVNIDDVRYVGLYDEYLSIINNNGKKSYAVAFLSEKYKISERKLYYLIRKFNHDCKNYAGG